MPDQYSIGSLIMRHILLAAAVMTGMAGLSQPAQAIGCVSGAVLGGAAGHVAGRHGLLGAAAGCYAGHHAAVMRNRAAAQARQQQMNQQPMNQQPMNQRGTPNTSNSATFDSTGAPR